MKRRRTMQTVVFAALLAGLAVGVRSPASASGNSQLAGLDLSNLDADERKLFDKVVGGEICPCGSAMSLGKCLQRDDVCDMARRAASLVADKVRKGFVYGEIVDAMIRMLEASAKPKEFTLAGRPFKGDAKAKVVLVEFSDFQCPHCSRMRAPLYQALREFPGKPVALYFKHYPLPFHAHASAAAQTAALAGARGIFWDVHDAIFDAQETLSAKVLADIKERFGLHNALPSELAAAQAVVAQDAKEGEGAGVVGTPTIFLNGIEVPSEDYTPEGLVARVREALESGK